MSESNNIQNQYLLDETFDADESLLVSPPPPSKNFNESTNGQFQFRGNNDSLFSDSSESFAQTPNKTFNYGAAMDALDDLVPSAMKSKRKRRSTMFSLEHSSAKKALQAEREEMNESMDNFEGGNETSFVSVSRGGFLGRLEEDEDVEVSMEEQQFDGDNLKNDESFELSAEAGDDWNGSADADNRDSSLSMESCSDWPPAELESENNSSLIDVSNGNGPVSSASTQPTSEGLAAANEVPGDESTERPSAFRYPCIRHDNSKEDEDLELKLGHAVNESFDGSRPEKVQMQSMSFDVADGNGTRLDSSNRLEPVDNCAEEEPTLEEYTEQNDHVSFQNDQALLAAPTFHGKVESEQTSNLAQVSSESDDFEMQLEGSGDKQFSFAVQDAVKVSKIGTTKVDAMQDESVEEGLEPCTDEFEFVQQPKPNKSELSPDITHDLDSAPFEYENILKSSNAPSIHTTFQDETTPPSLSALSETLSPIAKSSSPHNCDDNESSEKFIVLEKEVAESMEDKPGEFDEGKAKKNGDIQTIDTVPGSQIEEKHEQQVRDRSTIFDVLSRPLNEEPEPELQEFEVQSTPTQNPDGNSDMKETTPESAPYQTVHSPVAETHRAGENEQSPGDKESFQDTFNSKSSALLQRLRGAAETRKREVARCRHSLEQKEQEIMNEKEIRASMPTDASIPVETRRLPIISTKPKKKIEGLNPYKPFKARPLPSTSVKIETSRKSSASFHAPKKTTTQPIRKKLSPNEDPYKPFKAKPVPTTTSRQPTPSTAAKRRPSAPLRPHPEQNKSSVKPAALHAKPPSRLLSGRDASMAKEISLKERIDKENAKVRRDSAFKARPLPSSNLSPNVDLIGEKLLIEAPEAEAKYRKRSSACPETTIPIKKIQPFTPHSTRRAQERAAFDTERAKREQAEKAEQAQKRKQIIDRTKPDIDKLKSLIR